VNSTSTWPSDSLGTNVVEPVMPVGIISTSATVELATVSVAVLPATMVSPLESPAAVPPSLGLTISSPLTTYAVPGTRPEWRTVSTIVASPSARSTTWSPSWASRAAVLIDAAGTRFV
jgi:hypothetical protein